MAAIIPTGSNCYMHQQLGLSARSKFGKEIGTYTLTEGKEYESIGLVSKNTIRSPTNGDFFC
jgi:hypothetical protein